MVGVLRFYKTYQRIKKELFWEGMKINSKKMVSECQVCQINQGDIVKSLGLFQPLLILNQIWEEISMDLITGLPKSKDKIPFLWL